MAVKNATPETLPTLLSQRGITIVMYSLRDPLLGTWTNTAMRGALGATASRYRDKVHAVTGDVKVRPDARQIANRVPDFVVQRDGKVVDRFDYCKASWNGPGIQAWLSEVLGMELDASLRPHSNTEPPVQQQIP